MVRFIGRWISTLFRPKITTVHVKLYENSVEKPIERFSETRQLAILKSIEALFESRDKSQYWFEADIYETRSCTKKIPPYVCITCYKEDLQASSFKKMVDIPYRYRRKLFDTTHVIRPEQVGQIPWSAVMTVQFFLPK